MESKILSTVLVMVAVFILFIVINVLVKQLNQTYQTETALLSQVSDSEQVYGVFIRDEELLTYNGPGVISYAVPDGGKVGTNDVIANVYASEEQVQTQQKIASLENQLYLLKRISNPGTTQTAQPSNIAELFTQNFKDFLYHREQQNLNDLQSSKEEMLVLLSTYQLITGKDQNYAKQIQDIQNEITRLQKTQAVPLNVITAQTAAYFVSYADGYETELTLKDVNTLTAEQIASIQDYSIQKNPQVIGKMIKNYQWVLVAVVDNSQKKYKQGDRLTLKFSSTSETVTGEITSLNASAGEDKTIIGITCEAMTYDLVQHRAENVELIQNCSQDQGIRVPRNALHFQKITEEIKDEETGKTSLVTTEYRGVYILDGEQPAFRKLDVIYEGTDYVISAQHSGNEYLALYDSIITKGIDADGN